MKSSFSTRPGGRAGSICALRAYAGFFSLLALLAGASMVMGGCSDYGVAAPEGADTLSVPLPRSLGSGTADLFLYRITSLRSGERLGVSREFEVAPDRQVRAVLQMSGLEPGSELLLHVMWLNPERKEVFTKEVRVSAADWTDEARRQELEDALVHLDPRSGTLEMESRYGVDPIRFEEEAYKAKEDRRFRLGTWTVRFYLFRKRFLETTFELLPQS